MLQLSIKADQLLYQLAKRHANGGESTLKAEIAFGIEGRVREHLEALVRAEGVLIDLDSLAGV